MAIRTTLLFTCALLVGAVACNKTNVLPTADCESGPTWTCSKSGPCEVVGLPEMKGNLCSVGTADQIGSYNLGVQTASTRARAEMGAVLKSQVDGFTRAVQDSVSKSGSGEDSIQKVGDLAQNVVESTLYGVSVPRTHYNKETKVYYALAVLDTNTFVNALKGLKNAQGLSDSVKIEIEKRADGIIDEWERERARKDGR